MLMRSPKTVLPTSSLLAATLLLGALASPCVAKQPAPKIGRQVDPFQLADYRGKDVSLRDYGSAEAVVVCFMGTECPLAKLYGPKLERLHARYRERGVVVLGICSNVQDSLKEIAAYARSHKLSFPILRDRNNAVADLFGATRTPEVFLLDAQRAVRYQGRIDAQYTFGSGVGEASPAEKRKDLEIALQEVLAGKSVSVPQTPAKGCLIGRAKEPKQDAPVTYANQISRLFQRRCIECHREGQIAPFALTDYEEAAGWGDMVAEVVREQRMPPWHADPAHGEFSNENRLTKKEKQQVYLWVENGCPLGDVKDMPPPPEYHKGWFLPREPDLEIFMAEEPVAVKAEGVEPYRRFLVDPKFKEDKWVTLAECMPGNRAVVHHIIVYIVSPDAKDSNIGRHELLVGYAPGTRPIPMQPGWARKIPAGARLLFEMHYTPIGTPQKDRSSVGLIFTDREHVTHRTWTTNAINTRIEIPPHDGNHRETAEKTFQHDVMLFSLFPHMHMRGKSFRYEIFEPGSKQPKTLLNVPMYDFNWQNSFVLAKPLRIKKGTRLLCTAYYDNSDQNLSNPDPNATVRWGEQTWEEMLIGWHDVAAPIAK